MFMLRIVKWWVVLVVGFVCGISMLVMCDIAKSHSNNTVTWKGECTFKDVADSKNPGFIFKCENRDITITDMSILKKAFAAVAKPIICTESVNDWDNKASWACYVQN